MPSHGLLARDAGDAGGVLGQDWVIVARFAAAETTAEPTCGTQVYGAIASRVTGTPVLPFAHSLIDRFVVRAVRDSTYEGQGTGAGGAIFAPRTPTATYVPLVRFQVFGQFPEDGLVVVRRVSGATWGVATGCGAG